MADGSFGVRRPGLLPGGGVTQREWILQLQRKPKFLLTFLREQFIEALLGFFRVNLQRTEQLFSMRLRHCFQDLPLLVGDFHNR